MNVLVVGGAGYLGGAITEQLLKSKHKFKVYDNLFYEEEYLKPVDFIYGDIRDKARLESALKWADQVIWLAAIVGDKACLVNPEATYEINSQSVKWLSENFHKRIIFTSTCSVYGAKEGVVDESEIPNPISIYAGTKIIAENYLKDKNSIIFRMGTLFGASDEFSRLRLDLVVNSLTAEAFYNKKITIFGGKQYRPVLHVKDAAKIIVDNIDKHSRGIYNISRENLSLDEIGSKIAKLIPPTKIKKEKIINDFRTYRVSSEKAAKDLLFKPKLNVEDGIKEIESLLREGRIKDIANIRYFNHLALEKIFTPKYGKN